MTTQETIEQKIVEAIPLLGLDVINESHMHNVPAGSESHFKVVIISDDFQGQRLVQRHQRINQILADELAGDVHALSIQAMTKEEWDTRGGRIMPSPNCQGGSKRDSS
jgi:BolA protein